MGVLYRATPMDSFGQINRKRKGRIVVVIGHLSPWPRLSFYRKKAVLICAKSEPHPEFSDTKYLPVTRDLARHMLFYKTRALPRVLLTHILNAQLEVWPSQPESRTPLKP